MKPGTLSSVSAQPKTSTGQTQKPPGGNLLMIILAMDSLRFSSRFQSGRPRPDQKSPKID